MSGNKFDMVIKFEQPQLDMLVLIARMNLMVAEANRDIAVFGEWRDDYSIRIGQLELEYNKLKEQP